VLEHRCVPDQSRTVEVQRWLQENLSISHLGRNLPGAFRFRFALLPNQALNLQLAENF
jgi:hypothetical protein